MTDDRAPAVLDEHLEAMSQLAMGMADAGGDIQYTDDLTEVAAACE